MKQPLWAGLLKASSCWGLPAGGWQRDEGPAGGKALLLASEDLCPLLEKSGLMQDVRMIREELDFLLTPITNIKITYKDLVSNVTGSARQEADVESIDQVPSTHQKADTGTRCQS